MSNISLIEQFNKTSWVNYSAYGSANSQLPLQRHIDIRTFASDSGEAWTGTGVSFGSLPGYNHLPGLTMACTPGTNTATSTVMSRPLDLLTGFNNTDFISMALPAFSSSVNQSQSTITFTSADGNSSSVNLAQNLVTSGFVGLLALMGGSNQSLPSGGFTGLLALSPPGSAMVGNSIEYRVARGTLVGNADLTKIVTITITIVTSLSCTFTVMGLRLLAASWQYGAVDYDNWNSRLVTPVPPNGTLSTSVVFPTPIFWKSGSPVGPDDPRPIDSKFSTLFNTGSQTGANSLTLYYRENSKAYLTQLDLDQMTQAQLDGAGHQPDLGIAQFQERFASDLTGLTMDQLQGRSLFDIQTIHNPQYTGWIQFKLQWGTTNQATITNSSQVTSTYSFPNLQTSGNPVTLLNNHFYTLVTSIENTKVRFIVYDMNQSTFGLLPIPIFDTEIINDDFIFARRPGRFGWTATLADGDAHIESIRPSSLMFSEYRSAPLASETPVVGAQLYAKYSPNTQLFTTTAPYPASAPPKVVSDGFGGGSTRVTIVGNGGAGTSQGIITNVLPFINLSESEIHFDVFYPASLLPTNTLTATLQYVSTKAPTPLSIPLSFPNLKGNQWEHIVIYPGSSSPVLPAGDWQLTVQSSATVPSVWYIQNISIFERAVKWSARAIVDDPWHGNYAPWTPFRETVNSARGGVLFPVRGNHLQMQAKAFRQDAYISGQPSLVPKYGQLGLLVWPEQAPVGIVPPVLGAPFTGTTGYTVAFSPNITNSPTGPIILYEWDFGDGAFDLGYHTQHTYPGHGTYFVTVTAVDFFGNRAQGTTSLVL